MEKNRQWLSDDYRKSFSCLAGEEAVGKENLNLLPDARNMANIRDDCFSPQGFASFELRFQVEQCDENTVFCVGFGKPFEYALSEDSQVEISFEAERIVVQDGESYASAVPDGRTGEWRIVYSKEILTVYGGNVTLSLNVPKNHMIGYCTLFGKSGKASVVGVKLFSDSDVKPFSEEQRAEAKTKWQKWRMHRNEMAVDRFADYLEKHPEERLERPLEIVLERRMVRVGDSLRVSVVSRCEKTPSIYVTHNYLSEDSCAREMLPVEFIKNNEVWVGEFTLPFLKAGNTLIEAITGDIRIVRNVAVYDKGYLVVTPWIGSNIPNVDEELHKYDIPGDYWLYAQPLYDPPEIFLDMARDLRKMSYIYGDRIVPMINANWLMCGTSEGNLFELPSECQRNGFESTLKIMDLLGCDRTELIASYTFGNDTIGILKELGIKAVTSLCVWQNWQDSDWKINHWGAPNIPYYPSRDDFRRAVYKGDLMAFSMCTSSSVRNYSIYTQDGCPTLVCPGQRYTRQAAQHYSIQRFYDTFEGYLQDARNNDTPTYVTIAIEDFLGRDDWRKANNRALDYMAARAKTERIIFASAADITDFYAAEFEGMQPTAYFQPDFYCGYRIGAKPAVLPDRIEIDDPRYMAMFRKGETLPQFWYDYTHEWDAALFDDVERNQYGLYNPDEIDVSTLSPKQMDRRGVSAETACRVDGDTLTVTCIVNTPKPLALLPVAVYDIPLSDCRQINSDINVHKVADMYRNTTHLVAELTDVQAGRQVFELKFKGIPTKTEERIFCLQDALCIREAEAPKTDRNGVLQPGSKEPHCYLWSADGARVVRIILDGAQLQGARLLTNGGEYSEAPCGQWTIAVNQKWQNESPILFGVTAAELKGAVISVEYEN